MSADQIFSASLPRYFSIATGRPFLDDLARELTASFKAAGFEPSDAAIYLPTRRAARALSDAFLAASGSRAALTPHIRALGDIDEDEFALLESDATGALEDELALAPAISAVERRLILARWIAEKEKVYFDGQRRWAGAIAAADELGKLLDSLYTEEVDAAALDAIVPDDLALHWKDSLDFLKIITEAWPDYLAETKRFDPAARRIALIELQTKRWIETPPQTPVIIAGTTGSTPAVARMMKAVAGFPFGCVVLPGLDLAAPDHVWQAIDEPHPQSGLKALLNALGATRDNVRGWPVDGGEISTARADLVTMALRPADASDDWRAWADTVKLDASAMIGALAGLTLVEPRDEEREASVIALKMREVIETPNKTAMLVTPDRDLARRVATKMRRWNITVDDSAGAPFANTRCGNFLRLVAVWLDDVSHPANLAALIDHPLFGGGLSSSDRVKAHGKIDRALRGLRPARGIDGLKRRLETKYPLEGVMAQLVESLTRAAAIWPDDEASFAARFDAHLAAAEILSASDDEPGEQRLWRGDDGAAGAQMLANLRDGLALIVHDRPSEYADIFTRLIAGGAVRRRAPAHPRLSILGPLEARLQTADFVILAGLNEGVWPRDAAIDPFLSRQMRKNLNLPSPERRIGLAAHDFTQLAASPEVMLTRAARAAGKPTKPSRWIVRFKNILSGAELLDDIDQTAQLDALASRLDRPTSVTHIAPPNPRPPARARPTKFSVTRIEKLLRDPYTIYARDILKLKTLDALGEEFDARHLGSLFHKVLEVYALEVPPTDRRAQISRFESLFREHAPAFGFEARHEVFWRKLAHDAFERLADWDAQRRTLGAPCVIEGDGMHRFMLDGTEFTLTARADRIDLLHDGDAFIIDYKTGTPPTMSVTKKFSPQLPLTGFIVEEGGFSELNAAKVFGFEYLSILGSGKKSGAAAAQGDDASSSIAHVREGLFAILQHFADEANSYPSQPRPQYQDDFGDYDHLARRRERNAQGGDDGGGGDE